MNLNLTNLRDLQYICQIAEDYCEEPEWRKRIAKYRHALQLLIDQCEHRKELEPQVEPDSDRIVLAHIPVRARHPDGQFGTVDLSQLTRESFFAWLRSRGGSNLWAENTVALLLGYAPED